MARGSAGLLVLCVALLIGGCGSRRADSSRQNVPDAERFVDLLAKGDFSDASQRFDETMRQALPPAKLQDAWTAVVGQSGPFRKRLETRTAREQGFDAVYVTCQFEKSALAVKVVFDGSHRITGLWFVPPSA